MKERSSRHRLFSDLSNGDETHEWNGTTGGLLIPRISGRDTQDAWPEGGCLIGRQFLGVNPASAVHDLDLRCRSGLQIIEPAGVGGSAAIGGHDDRVRAILEELEEDGPRLSGPPSARREDQDIDL